MWLVLYCVGMNLFLKNLDITFRRDPTNYRPRINKMDSVKDREQKLAGSYYYLDDWRSHRRLKNVQMKIWHLFLRWEIQWWWGYGLSQQANKFVWRCCMVWYCLIELFDGHKHNKHKCKGDVVALTWCLSRVKERHQNFIGSIILGNSLLVGFNMSGWILTDC